MSRRLARENAFKLIFEIPFYGFDRAIERVDFNFEISEDESISDAGKVYVKNVVKSCFDNIDIIDNKISDSLKNWKIERLSKVDLAILRLSAAEIMYVDDVPYKVSVNEAVEIAKKFGDDQSPAFINGVLSKFDN